MQSSTIFTIFALAATTLAAPALDLAPRTCNGYSTGSYLSVCRIGDAGLFCGGNVGICPSASGVDTFDATATAANEAACVGLKAGVNCVQTVACC